jgi:hypothetical protein
MRRETQNPQISSQILCPFAEQSSLVRAATSAILRVFIVNLTSFHCKFVYTEQFKIVRSIEQGVYIRGPGDIHIFRGF